MIFRENAFIRSGEREYFRADSHSVTECLRETVMSNVLRNWILISSNAYDEYTFVPWLNRNVYRRTVELSRVCIQ
jgi:hypothetical protein